MSWVVFSYSLTSKGHSSPRVTIWRRLRRIGAILAGVIAVRSPSPLQAERT